MGLFGSIGKVFGSALKIAGGVASIASKVAPIPGLGIAGGVAKGLGGFLSKAKGVQAAIATPGVLTSTSPIMPGGARINGGAAMVPKPTTTVMTAIGPLPIPSAYAAAAPTKRKRRRSSSKRKRRRSSSRSSRSRRGGRRKLTRAQLRAGFGGKRRMRR